MPTTEAENYGAGEMTLCPAWYSGAVGPGPCVPAGTPEVARSRCTAVMVRTTFRITPRLSLATLNDVDRGAVYVLC